VKLALGQLSLSMETGTVAKWLVADGGAVSAGQVIAEVETDKAIAEVEAPASGTLRIIAAEGDTVPVGGPLAEIDEGGSP